MKDIMLFIGSVLVPAKRTILVVLLLALLVLIGFVGRQYIMETVLPTIELSENKEELVDVPQEGISEETLQILVEGITGNLIVDAAGPRTENTRSTSVYDINPGNPADVRLVLQDGLNFNFKPVTTNTGVAIQYIASLKRSVPVTYDLETQKPSALPVADGYQARSFFASSFENWYAGDVYRVDVPRAERMNLESWQVVVLNPVTEEQITIENASSPQWLNDSDDVVYIKADGVYRFNFFSGTEERIVDTYTDLTANAQLAIDTQSRHLVLTIPSSNTMAVFEITDARAAELNELNQIFSMEYRFYSPVFSPDGTYFAVVQNDLSDFNPVTGVYAENNIAIYTPGYEGALIILPITELAGTDVTITDWTDIELQIPNANPQI